MTTRMGDVKSIGLLDSEAVREIALMFSRLFPAKSDKDVLISLLAMQLNNNLDEYVKWIDLSGSVPNCGYTLDAFGGSYADLKQQLDLMKEVLAKVDLLQKLDAAA